MAIVVSLILVAHSAELAESAKSLAEQVAGGAVRIAAAGGVADAEHPLGTDATRVAQAIAGVCGPDGVLVLVDLGSALLSAETALELVPAELRRLVRISAAALVEGAVAAAAAAAAGSSLDAVESEARRALLPKEQHLGVTPVVETAGHAALAEPGMLSEEAVLPNALGIHARPAGLIVAAAARFDARVSLTNASRARHAALANSLTQVAMLDGRQGDRIEVQASGPQARDALRAVAGLIRTGFGESTTLETSQPPSGPATDSLQLAGLPGSPGVAAGPARALAPQLPALPLHPPQAPARERERLDLALQQAKEETRTLGAKIASAGEAEAGVFSAQLQLIDDPELTDASRALVARGGVTAEQAWQQVSEAVAERFGALDSPLLAARASDVRDVTRRVLLALAGAESAPARLPEPSIGIASELLPSDVTQLDPIRTLGLATAFGAPNSHACILARALGIPMVVGLGAGILRLPEGQVIGLDGSRGLVFPEITASRRAELESMAAARRSEMETARAACQAPATTRDGRSVEVVANIARMDELSRALSLGAEGIGVLRTEFLFLGRETPPPEAEQEEAYRAALSALAGRRVIVRTLDIGGDKPVPYLPPLSEANPYLGERGLRRSLRHPDLFLAQARALYRSAPTGRLHILLPMVTTRDEVSRARALLDRARREVGLAAAARVPVGIMIETPAAALGIEGFMDEVDFFSIGTNDLTQYTLAAERGNAGVAALYDACHPAVLRQIQMAVDAAHRSGKWAGVCGEVAADPEAIPILIGLGVDELSMTPDAIPSAKQQIRQLRFDESSQLAREALELDSATEVRALTRQSTPKSERTSDLPG